MSPNLINNHWIYTTVILMIISRFNCFNIQNIRIVVPFENNYSVLENLQLLKKIDNTVEVRHKRTLDDINYYEAEELKEDLNSREEKINIENNKIEEAIKKEELDLTTEEPCVGDKNYCNLTREDYVKMLENYIYPQPYEWVLIATHTIVFVVGLVGNALVCISVYRNHTMRTVTNLFIVNLAMADFMVILFCLPPTVLWDVTETWFLGKTFCKLLLYFQVIKFQVIKLFYEAFN